MANTIGGSKREKTQLPEFVKKVGLFEGRVIAINPTAEEYKELFEIELKEDSKTVEYLGESKEDNVYLRVDVWLEDIKTKDKFRVSFFLEDKIRENKDLTKKQYINNVGSCSWADDPNNLPEWFSARDYRVAYVGEEELYNFLRVWLSELDYRNADTTLQLDWKKLMKGNVKDLKDQINGEWCTNIGALATINVREKDGETKEYQNVYNKAFLYPGSIKNFRLVDYMKPNIVSALSSKKPKELKPHERFVLTVTGEYGCKDFYLLKELKEYNSEDNLVASDKVISEEGADY